MPINIPRSPIGDLIDEGESPVAMAIIVAIAWLILADGQVADRELERLHEMVDDMLHFVTADDVLDIVRNISMLDLMTTCQIMRSLSDEHRVILMDMLIGFSLADGRLQSTENHVLRFFADLLGIGLRGLRSMYFENTGKDLPNPPDSSSATFWNRQRQTRRSSARQSSNHDRGEASDHQDRRRNDRDSRKAAQRVEALATLGLVAEATEEEIRESYRRLVRIHHPDRFSPLGQEAVQVATRTFTKIQAAYELLSSTS